VCVCVRVCRHVCVCVCVFVSVITSVYDFDCSAVSSHVLQWKERCVHRCGCVGGEYIRASVGVGAGVCVCVSMCE